MGWILKSNFHVFSFPTVPPLPHPKVQGLQRMVGGVKTPFDGGRLPTDLGFKPMC